MFKTKQMYVMRFDGKHMTRNTIMSLGYTVHQRECHSIKLVEKYQRKKEGKKEGKKERKKCITYNIYLARFCINAIIPLCDK